MHDDHRRRRLVARLAAGARTEWLDELRLLPESEEVAGAAPFAGPAPFAEPADDTDVRLLPTAADFPLPVRAPTGGYPATAEGLPVGVEPASLPRPSANAGLANTGPLPDPLPPPLDAAVRALREDLLTSGGDAAALADEICARHRDALRAALGVLLRDR